MYARTRYDQCAGSSPAKFHAAEWSATLWRVFRGPQSGERVGRWLSRSLQALDPRQSLQSRLSVSLSLVLLCAAGAISVMFIVQAREDVRREVESAGDQSRRLLNVPDETATVNMSAQHVSQLDKLHHLRLVQVGSEASVSEFRVPRVFAEAIAGRSVASTPVRIDANGDMYSLVAVNTDEVTEIWEEVSSLAPWAAAGFALLNIMLWWEVGRILKPLRTLRQGLHQIEMGRLQTRLPPFRDRDLADLSAGFNRMADALAQAQDRLREMHAQFFAMQEQERKRISRDLHDEFGQTLTAIRAQIAHILGSAVLPEGTRRSAEQIASDSGLLMRHLRTMLDHLRPDALDVLGLEAALQDLCESCMRRFPEIEVALRYGTSIPAGEHAGIHVYRVVQEALTNAVRHGKARGIRVSVQDVDPEVLVTVEDDGIGMRVVPTDGRWGLIGMRERVESLGGTFALSTARHGSGVLVACRFPMRCWRQ